MAHKLLNQIEARKFLHSLFHAAVASAQPALCLPQHLPEPPELPKGRLIVVGAGKAAAAMAQAVESHYPGPLSGLVVTRYGYGRPCQRIEVLQAAHPIPDQTSLTAARRIRAMVADLSADDLVLCLISGGGSALLAEPVAGVTLAEKQALSGALLKCGASISEINCVRRHLSAIKGGHLGVACHPAQVLSLVISDVPGDQLVDIASGPMVADPTTCADALAVLRRYAIDVPDPIRAALESGAGETIKPGDARLARVRSRLIATPQMALQAAASMARQAGLAVHILADDIEGEARDVGKVMAAMARQIVRYGQPFAAPCLLLSGGETTVTVRGLGCGGRNVEFLLAMAVSLAGLPGVHALAGDTDGVDGMAEIAGAYIGPQTLARAAELGLSARGSLDNNDGHGFFTALGDAIITGPTWTNVNDFRAILITGAGAPSLLAGS